ncbi:hypothetical protein EUTSA_v10027061mg [Eutrema salsugineum]|uniref:Late embryogenesis abundant protein LEA-2 subgroup domain-containing protein n=1 Tax=Eutrema salsugineum TaxID=72664 RepID=V4MA38_EUTSA|nr:hypothetical protein EUTSA_v10027061mg [Eutrema salsugineum]
MEGSRLPSTSASTSTVTNNQDKPGDSSSTWHRPTNSLPDHLPSSTSQVSSPPPHFRKNSLSLFPILPSSSPPPDPIPEIETYVVQVPRDQVYWIPPQENARIVERRMNGDHQPGKKHKIFCSKRLMWIFIAVIVIGFIICAIAIIIRFLFKPKPHVFDVKKLANGRIMLTSKNPTLTYNITRTSGKGISPKLSQAMYGFDTVNLNQDCPRTRPCGRLKPY